jgi:hypothetical protein
MFRKNARGNAINNPANGFFLDRDNLIHLSLGDIISQ